jgi:hypothetical protein
VPTALIKIPFNAELVDVRVELDTKLKFFTIFPVTLPTCVVPAGPYNIPIS